MRALTAPMEALDPNLVSSVRDIIVEVRSGGDHALLEFTRQFDQHPSDSISQLLFDCLLYTSPSPRDATLSRMPSSA